LATTILIGFEPFLQAIIDYEGRPVAISSGINGGVKAAGIGRSTVLDVGRYQLDTSGGKGQVHNWEMLPDHTQFKGDGYYSRPDFGTTAAVWAGFSNASTADKMQPAFSCSTGNCTWPIFASIGVCSRCNDVTFAIETSKGMAANCERNPGSCGNGSLPDVTIIWENSRSKAYNMSVLLPYTKHAIHGLGQNLSLSNWDGHYDGGNCPDCKYATMVAAAVTDPGLTISFKELQTMLITYTYIQADQSLVQNRTLWQDTPVTAHECSLYYCAMAFNSSVTNGELHEDVLGTWPHRVPGSFGDGNASLSQGTLESYNRFKNYSLLPELYTDTVRSALQLQIPRDEAVRVGLLDREGHTNGSVNDNGTSSSGRAAVADPAVIRANDGSLIFNLTQSTVCSTIRWLVTDFSMLPGVQPTQLIYPSDYFGSNTSPPVISSLGESANITATMETVAASMTKWMRDLARDQQQPLQGETLQWIVHVKVQWPYLALPVIVLAAGVLFTLASIWRTRRLGLPAWRGSALATLTSGLDGPSRTRLRAADHAGVLADAAREAKVSLIDSQTGPELALLDEPDSKGLLRKR
jgi:hypothetical protein